jgi:membrane peptidoglycan carboxypeptidase
VDVVDRGTGKGVKLSGTTIAGKTGTSRKHVNGGYESGAYNASFVGFFPAEAPEVAILVIIEHPSMAYYTGALASVPVFRAIAERIINNNGALTRTTIAENTGSIILPDVSTLDVRNADTMLNKIGLVVRIVGAGTVVRHQIPDPGSALASGSVVQLITTENISAAGCVPDLRGMSVRRAVNMLVSENLIAVVAGSGSVVSQTPEPGTPVRPGEKITMRCEPKQISTAQLY